MSYTLTLNGTLAPNLLTLGSVTLRKGGSNTATVQYLTREMVSAGSKGWLVIDPQPLTFTPKSVPVDDQTGGVASDGVLNPVITIGDLNNALATMASGYNKLWSDVSVTVNVIPNMQQQFLDVESRLTELGLGK